jgi:hypothetical protein
MIFRAAPDGLVADRKELALAPEQVVGRVDPDGSGRLEIARSLSTEAAMELRNKGAVCLPPIPLLEQHKWRAGGENEAFHLTIWSADKDVLHKALARFWGAAEDLHH